MQINFHELIKIKIINYWRMWSSMQSMGTLVSGLKEQLGLKQTENWRKYDHRGCFEENIKYGVFLEFPEILKFLEEPNVQQLWGPDWWDIPNPILSSPAAIMSPNSGLSDLHSGVINKWPMLGTTLILHRMLKNDQILEISKICAISKVIQNLGWS